ncbi:hypothetical protein Hte_005111 [Hypoxylon texense]
MNAITNALKETVLPAVKSAKREAESSHVDVNVNFEGVNITVSTAKASKKAKMTKPELSSKAWKSNQSPKPRFLRLAPPRRPLPLNPSPNRKRPPLSRKPRERERDLCHSLSLCFGLRSPYQLEADSPHQAPVATKRSRRDAAAVSLPAEVKPPLRYDSNLKERLSN